MKTLDITAREWWDKVNGNSYFAARATIDYGTPDEKTIVLPFQYGYGDHYRDMAFCALIGLGYITSAEKYANGGLEALWRWCERSGVVLRASKTEGCKKRDVKEYGTANSDEIQAAAHYSI